MELGLMGLSWATLVTIASGYSGYYIANVGLRDHHKAIEITFASLVFGFFSTAAYLLTQMLGGGVILATVLAFLVGMSLGAAWSKFGRKLLTRLLREHRVSHSDEMPSALQNVFAETGTDMHRLSVQMTDGTWLVCERMDQFKDAPNGPAVIGRHGDVLLYVTHRRKPNGEYEAIDDVDLPDWGQEATYVPAAHVRRIDMRRKWREKS